MNINPPSIIILCKLTIWSQTVAHHFEILLIEYFFPAFLIYFMLIPFGFAQAIASKGMNWLHISLAYQQENISQEQLLTITSLPFGDLS